MNRYAAKIIPTETIYSHSLTTRIIDIAINPYSRTIMILDGSYPSQTIYVSLVDIYLCGCVSSYRARPQSTRLIIFFLRNLNLLCLPRVVVVPDFRDL